MQNDLIQSRNFGIHKLLARRVLSKSFAKCDGMRIIIQKYAIAHQLIFNLYNLLRICRMTF